MIPREAGRTSSWNESPRVRSQKLRVKLLRLVVASPKWCKKQPQISIVGIVIVTFILAVISVVLTGLVIALRSVELVVSTFPNVLTTFYIALNKLTNGEASLTSVIIVSLALSECCLWITRRCKVCLS